MTIQEFKCPHGFGPFDPRYLGTWMAPFTRCRCCGIMFPYIDSSYYGTSGGGGRSWTKDRCRECGGHYIEWGIDLGK